MVSSIYWCLSQHYWRASMARPWPMTLRPSPTTPIATAAPSVSPETLLPTIIRSREAAAKSSITIIALLAWLQKTQPFRPVAP